MTELADRMRLYTKGQVTWPEPSINRRCDACRHYTTTGAPIGKGRCALVRGMHGYDGVTFKGADAIACPKFERS